MYEIIIAELAGKDSIASIIKYAKENKDVSILPTIVKIPSEEDRYEDLLIYYECLKDYIKSLGSTMFSPVFIDAKKYWWNLNNPISDLIEKYNFYSPCIACHGLLHAVRIPIARQYNGKIITGERLSHNNKIKLNQNKIVLDLYDKLFKQFGVEFVRPLENIHNTDEIDLIVKDFYDKYNIKNIKYINCYMSGNSQVKSIEDLKEYKIEEYCNEYLLPKLDFAIEREMYKRS